jgi:hypothetical protein
MLLNTLEVTLTPRTDTDAYRLQVNEAAFDILNLIFEFKVATAWQIARFLGQKEESKYLYLKLRRMWQAGFLESFKIYTGSRAGMPVYYMLSKKALKLLAEQGKYPIFLIKNYPKPKMLFSWGIFRHELQVVELASQEVKNGSTSFSISFKGELSSQIHDARSEKSIEVFTPDYTVFYRMGELDKRIYTEFERTNKSIEAMGRKIERYLFHLDQKAREHTTLRFIFQNSNMEYAFWRNAFLGQAPFLQKLRVLTTNLNLLESHERFLEPIYASEQTAKLTKKSSLDVDLSTRIKLFSFL